MKQNYLKSEQRRKATYPLTKAVFVTAGNKNVESIFLLLPGGLW